MKRLVIAFFILAMVSLTWAAYAFEPGERLEDPVLEQRARALGSQLRCLVCQGQSIDDSDSELAQDLRILIRQRIQAGDSDNEVKHYLASRYGEYILLKPPLSIMTFILWVGTPLFLIISTIMLINYSQMRAASVLEQDAESAQDERKRLEEMKTNQSTYAPDKDDEKV